MTKVQQKDGWIDYIEFGVEDLERAKAFYEAVFGWKFTDYGAEYASFFDGRLYGGMRVQQQCSTGAALVVIYAKELDAMQERVQRHGGKIVKETFSFPGGSRFHFEDLDGNVLAVWSDH